MARQRPVDQVETLRAKQKALMEKLREAQAKARADQAETKRKRNEIAGAVAMQELEANPGSPFAVAFRELLNAGVTTAGKRALLGLPALPKAPGSPPDFLPVSVGSGVALQPTQQPEAS